MDIAMDITEYVSRPAAFRHVATDSWWTSGGASLFALVRRFSTGNLEILSQSRADLGLAQSSSFWRGRVPRTSTRAGGTNASPRRP
jgi:hypothetical protein